VKPSFHNKKACLTGVSSGRAGNLRGMDHLTNVMSHIKVTTFTNKLPISSIGDLVNDARVLNSSVIELIEQQVEGFLKF